jgi:hypothetical protein
MELSRNDKAIMQRGKIEVILIPDDKRKNLGEAN